MGKYVIESADNNHIKRIRKLLTNARFRKQEQAFVVEGWKMAGEALRRHLVEALFVADWAEEEYGKRIADGDLPICQDGILVGILAGKLFRGLSDTVNPQGIIAVVRMPQYDRGRLIGSPRAAVLCLEDIRDPGNLGTMVRTAEGAGMSGLVLSKGCADLFNPKVVRSTMGAIFRVPYIFCEDMPAELELLKSDGFTLYAAHLGGECGFTEVDYMGRVGILVGNEAHGLRDEASAKADRLVRIPMEGELESLNAAVSAALLMYEVHRQRR